MNGTRTRRVGTMVGVTALLAVLAVPTSLPAAAVDVPDQVLAWNQYAYNELIVTKLPTTTGLGAEPRDRARRRLRRGERDRRWVRAVSGFPVGREQRFGGRGGRSRGVQVLLCLLPSDRAAALLGDYNASLEAILGAGVSQARIDAGVAVGEAAAAAMVTRARATATAATGPRLFYRGHGPRPVADGSRRDRRQQLQVGRQGRAVPDRRAPRRSRRRARRSSRATTYAAEFKQVKTLGSGDGFDEDAEPDRRWRCSGRTTPSAMWTRIFRQISDEPGALDDRERALLRDALSHGGRRADRVLRGQGATQLLATADRDPAGRDRRERGDGRRSGLDVVAPEPAVLGSPVGAQLRQRLVRRRRCRTSSGRT